MDQKIIIADPSNLSKDSLISEYQNLCKYYNEAKLLDNSNLQQIHQLRRELQTALNDKLFLSSELEIINTEHTKEIESIQQKHRDELNSYKHSLSTYKDDLELVEVERDKLEKIVEDLQKQCVDEKQTITNVSIDNSHTEKFVQLAAENDELAEVIENLQCELTDALKKNLELEREIEDLHDRLRCAEENLRTKRDELEEKNELYETAQERVIQLSGELNSLRSESDTASKRGNSLFAEVDDQRQKMKNLLKAQKANYIQMKNEVEASQHEIRKLKRENVAVHKEIELCSHVFLNAEQHHTEKLNERIGELMKENESINKKLIFTEQCLSDMIKKNDVNWLDPMLALCKNETKEIKDQLYRCSLQKVAIADTLRKSEEETARWRFEALKSRCIIAERESLLEDNKIQFDVVSGIDQKIRKINNENVSPNISTRTSLLSFKRRSITKSQSPLVKMSENVQSLRNSSEAEAEVAKMESSSNQTEVVHIEKTDDTIENELKVKLEPDIESSSKFIAVESNQNNQPKKMSMMEASHVEQSVFKSPCSSAVTVRKKNCFGKTSLLRKNDERDNGSMANLRSPGTYLPSLIRPKINSMKNTYTGGILKQSTNSNISSDKKVKFDDGSVVNMHLERQPSLRKVEKLDNVPKTAIKKRIFISSKKPSTSQ